MFAIDTIVVVTPVVTVVLAVDTSTMPPRFVEPTPVVKIPTKL